MNGDWDRARYEQEKQKFIESRLALRAIWFHTALIFVVTWLAGWFCSYLLLRTGMASMPLRYALSFGFSYLVFMLCVRVWADSLRVARTDSVGGDLLDVADVASIGDGEGCLIAVVALVAGMAIAALFAASGGLPLLLEAAFEVVFAGVIVRRISGRRRVGDWAETLLRNTWRHAAVALIVLVSLAAWLQARAPDTRTFAQAVHVLMAK
jgi:FtsH-binding integral membrane protein